MELKKPPVMLRALRLGRPSSAAALSPEQLMTSTSCRAVIWPRLLVVCLERSNPARCMHNTSQQLGQTDKHLKLSFYTPR